MSGGLIFSFQPLSYQPFQLINVTPLLTLEEAIASVKPATDFASAIPGAQIVVEELDSWWAFFEKYVTVYESVRWTEHLIFSSVNMVC